VGVCAAVLATAGALGADALGADALGADALTPGVGVANGCGNPPVTGSQPVTLMVDAKPRTALVHTPPQAAAGTRLPLIIALHGVGGGGPRMESYSGLSVVSDRGGFIVAYPSSHGSFWNSTGSPRLTNDVRFIRSLIAYLRQSMCVDAARIYVAGVSNGGGMAALAGCELSAQISGFASVAGGYDDQPVCRPKRPESVLEIHGTADQVVPYAGGTHRRPHVGVPQFVAGWVRRDRCHGSATVRHPATRTTVFRWDHCAAAARVEQIRITGGRHAWPGATPPDPGPPSTICAACAVWGFFSSLSSSGRG
jgi:polyhydroxybutyrate depolymerase